MPRSSLCPKGQDAALTARIPAIRRMREITRYPNRKPAVLADLRSMSGTTPPASHKADNLLICVGL